MILKRAPGAQRELDRRPAGGAHRARGRDRRGPALRDQAARWPPCRPWPWEPRA
ncbi:MAG: hypothetical protein MZV70_19870 [Desulfobacterales bacterium]|nr:hypothetical protein [Desulfobacterales bacterium]